MTTAKKTRPISPDLLGAELAIKRAAQRAREIAYKPIPPVSFGRTASSLTLRSNLHLARIREKRLGEDANAYWLT
jgi:hypothetical protein